MMEGRFGDEDELFFEIELIDGQEFDIPVHVGEGVPEFLIGRQWLKTRRLVVDVPSGVLTLGN